jgi:hypothetical protein
MSAGQDGFRDGHSKQNYGLFWPWAQRNVTHHRSIDHTICSFLQDQASAQYDSITILLIVTGQIAYAGTAEI